MIMKKLNKPTVLWLLIAVLAVALFAWYEEAIEDDGDAYAATASVAKPPGALPLKTVADVELPGPTNRFDYQSYDPRTHLLFIAHLAAGTVVVFDTASNKVVAELPNISQVHGVLVVPDLHKVYASATGTNEIVVIDENALKEVARIPGGVYPDGMAYAPAAQKLYVSDQSGKTETVIDARTDKRIKTIPLKGEAGNSQYDPVSKHIFVNVQTTQELAEIDPVTGAVIARHPLAGAGRNHGLLIEPAQRLAFIACEDNAKLLVFDMKSMKVISSEAVGDDPDVLAFDDTLHVLYIASESGVVSMFKLQGQILGKIAEGHLADKAHSVAVDQQTHRVYFPLQNLNGRAVLRIMEPTVK
jgi:YVTN family beta-propeller protein